MQVRTCATRELYASSDQRLHGAELRRSPLYCWQLTLPSQGVGEQAAMSSIQRPRARRLKRGTKTEVCMLHFVMRVYKAAIKLTARVPP